MNETKESLIADQIADAVKASAELPDVFLGYQKRLMNATSIYPVVFCEKSRRIGVTWGIAADAVLHAAANRFAGGMDVFYIGFNLDMTREFIDTCAGWAKAFSHIATEVEEFVFKEQDAHGETKEIQAFRIKFDSGFEITALTSRPRSLRGRQGYVIIDEAAFHDDLKELMKAALALLMWGGKVLVISTHDGADNAFNEYINEIRGGKRKYHLMRIDLDDALADGLYERICLKTHKTWSPDAQAAWRQELVDFYGEGADEELFCIPRLSAGAYMPSVLIESRMKDGIPVLRLKRPDEFTLAPEYERQRDIEDWCATELKPILDSLNPKFQSTLGGDAGRTGDLSVFWPFLITGDLMRETPFVVELHKIPFRQQLQIQWYILDRLPRLYAVAMDARGLGQQMAEETAQRYGGERVHQVMTSLKWYLDAFPKYKAAYEDGTIIIPRDSDIKDDHRAAVIQNGIPQLPDKRTKGANGQKRHGDSLVAAAMGYWASLQDVVLYDYTPAVPQQSDNFMRPRDDDRDDLPGRFQSMQGSW